MGRTSRKEESRYEEPRKMVISLDDLTDELSEEVIPEERMIELQLTMATTSINHEYAKIEYEESGDYERKEELLNFMSDCRGKYVVARNELAKHNPLALEEFERDLILQKLSTITHYNA